MKNKSVPFIVAGLKEVDLEKGLMRWLMNNPSVPFVLY